MKPSLSYLVGILLLSTLSVSGNSYATLFDFNYGIEEAGKFCSSQEWTLVQAVIANATLMATNTPPNLNENATVPPGRIRGRQRDLAHHQQQQHHPQHRQLRFCRNCGRYCAMLGLGCVVQGRRRLEGSSSEHDALADIASQETSSHRRLTTACDRNITAVTTALEQLRPSLSTECQLDLCAPQHFLCPHHDQLLCGILCTLECALDTVMFSNFSGQCFNRRTYVAVKAKTNYYLGSARFVVMGGPTQLNTADIVSPYFIMGNDPSNIFGMYFAAGSYTLTAMSEDGNGFSKSINFTSRSVC
jgi:hypothetical protein